MTEQNETHDCEAKHLHEELDALLESWRVRGEHPKHAVHALITVVGEFAGAQDDPPAALAEAISHIIIASRLPADQLAKGLDISILVDSVEAEPESGPH